MADHAAENPRVTMGEMLIEGSKACLKLEGDGKISMRNQGDSHWTPHTYQYTTDNFGGDCVYALQRHVADHLLYHADLHNCAQQSISKAPAKALDLPYELTVTQSVNTVFIHYFPTSHAA
ncbi:hypothetical protein [Marinomonas flavescens]|uniref:hypothetical protein n=1 Tax=Marinomonas flavescens TaxID=2529379 RepID=UPI0010562502|nr:hypothetical protein [Marinomonas flavescens]